MAPANKAKEVLAGLGLSEEQVESIVAGIGQQKTAAEQSGVRQKAFDLGMASEAINSLQTQLKTLSDQIAGIDLAQTAAKALDAVETAREPVQETYTLDDLKTVIAKAFSEAMVPIVEKQQKESDALVALVNQLHELGTVAKTAQAKVDELSGELPRALKVPAVQRYADAVGHQPDRPALSAKEENDSFGWVDDYLARQ